MSVLDFFRLGSSLSLRSIGRVGAQFSVFGMTRLGSTVSVVDFASLGSSLSLRSACRLGSSFAIFAGLRFGSSLSVLDFVHLGSCLSVGSIKATTVSDGTGTTYAKFTTASVELYAGSQRGLSVTSNGGMLHGAWSSDATVTTSDRRLKRNIEPLYRTIAARANSLRGQAGAADSNRGVHQSDTSSTAQTALGARRPREPPVGWLLRELRPVSFFLKRGPEAKYLKFGFVAQELESVFPNLVRTTGTDDTKAVASQDLIAVLTLALQMLQKDFEEQRRQHDELLKRMARLEQVVYTARV